MKSTCEHFVGTRPGETGLCEYCRSAAKFTVATYLDNGVVFHYDVPSAHKAREHASAIIATGYRHNDGKGEFEHYPPHRIQKVKISGAAVPTLWPDEVRGT